ncbi:MAG: hypothetical protein JO372_25515 [Solirubrobacterales bacterium]|nr:hypothetical protein [Solirubrobacterales bacterium]
MSPGGSIARLQTLVDNLGPNIASVYDVHYDYLAWNEPHVRVRNDPGNLPERRRNMLRMMFTDAENRARMVRLGASCPSRAQPVPGRSRPTARRSLRTAHQRSRHREFGVPQLVDRIPGA